MMSCGCPDGAHPASTLAGYSHHYELCPSGWPLRGTDGERLLTRDGEQLALQLAREDDTAEHVLEFIDSVRDTGSLYEHRLCRTLSLEQIGCMIILRLSDDVFRSVASAFPHIGAKHIRINLHHTTLMVVPSTPQILSARRN